MQEEHIRKPISNFFIKKELQIRLIKKIVVAVLIATIVSVATLLLTYLVKYKSTVIYQVTFETVESAGDDDQTSASISDREKITSLILPSLIISGIINIMIAIFIGLYASRKYAVPVFKLEQWAKLLNQGHMSAQLRFREKEEMNELSDSCNKLSDGLRSKFNQIEKLTKELKEMEKSPDVVKKIQDILDTVEFKSETIEVHTSYLTKDQLPKAGKVK